jgi:APA family basic amino acid/polyamine antiporter
VRIRGQAAYDTGSGSRRLANIAASACGRQTTPMLNRSISLLGATSLVIGIIVGASIFVQPSVISGAVPTVGAVYAVWIVAGILTLFGSLIAAELSSAFPRSGGVYVFLSTSFGHWLGFLWGWAMFWTMHTGIAAVIAMVFARYVGFFFPMSDAGLKGTAAAAIVVVSAINYVGVRHGSRVQTAFTLGKLLAIGAIIIAGVVVGPQVPFPAAAPPSADAALTTRGFVVALIAALFAYGGWHMVTYAAEETRDPERTIPRALAIGTLVVTACYIGLNAVYFHLLPVDKVVSSTRVAADAADAMFGSGGAASMSALVMFSTFGALTGVILAGPRVYLSMARDGLLFSWAGAIHPRYQTPHRAILLQAGWAIVLVATGTYRDLFTRVVYTEWIFFALMAIGLMILRRRPDYAPAYRVWGYPLVPVIFAGASLYIVANEIISEPGKSLTGLGLVIAGLPVYWLTRTFRNRSVPAHAD